MIPLKLYSFTSSFVFPSELIMPVNKDDADSYLEVKTISIAILASSTYENEYWYESAWLVL